MRRGCIGAVMLALGTAAPLSATVQDTWPAATPAVEMVRTVGCAERRPGPPATWWLARAVAPEVVTAAAFNVTQVEEAHTATLGTSVFRLIGEADFLDTAGALASDPRASFATPDTVNATGQLDAGRKVLVKGLLIDAGQEQRINLVSVVRLADTCR